jgi:hypothetical protein
LYPIFWAIEKYYRNEKQENKAIGETMCAVIPNIGDIVKIEDPDGSTREDVVVYVGDRDGVLPAFDCARSGGLYLHRECDKWHKRDRSKKPLSDDEIIENFREQHTHRLGCGSTVTIIGHTNTITIEDK